MDSMRSIFSPRFVIAFAASLCDRQRRQTNHDPPPECGHELESLRPRSAPAHSCSKQHPGVPTHIAFPNRVEIEEPARWELFLLALLCFLYTSEGTLRLGGVILLLKLDEHVYDGASEVRLCT